MWKRCAAIPATAPARRDINAVVADDRLVTGTDFDKPEWGSAD